MQFRCFVGLRDPRRSGGRTFSTLATCESHVERSRWWRLGLASNGEKQVEVGGQGCWRDEEYVDVRGIRRGRNYLSGVYIGASIFYVIRESGGESEAGDAARNADSPLLFRKASIHGIRSFVSVHPPSWRRNGGFADSIVSFVFGARKAPIPRSNTEHGCCGAARPRGGYSTFGRGGFSSLKTSLMTGSVSVRSRSSPHSLVECSPPPSSA